MFLEKDPILKIVHDFRKNIIFEKIQNLPETNFIQSLWYYFEDGTQRFYDKECFAAYFSILNHNWENNKNLLREILENNSNDLNKNLPTLRELNKANFNDSIIPTDNYDLIQLIDTIFNPRYLKAIEGPYFALTYPIASCLRQLRSTSLEGLDIFNIVEEINKTTSLSSLTKPYHNIIRNGIAHGSVLYGNHEIIYKGKRGNPLNTSASSIIEIYDKLIDCCNAMALALLVFYLQKTDIDNNFSLPKTFLIDELIAQVNSPFFSIYSVLESRLNESKSQLNIYTKDKNNSHFREQVYCFRTAIISEYLAPGYDRYFITLHSKYSKSPVGWAAFNGKLLKELRENKSSNALDYSKTLEDEMIFHIPKYKLPGFFSTISSLWQSYKLNSPIHKKEYKRNKYGFELIIRQTKMHRNGFYSVIHVDAVIKNLKENELEKKY